MPLVATRGAASAQGFGEFAVTSTPTYIEDVFSTYLYTVDGTTTQAIPNGIDLTTFGGIVWEKARDQAYNNCVTYQSASKYLVTNTTGAANNTGVTYTTNGYTMNSVYGPWSPTSTKMASWTLRKQPKYFDIQTWTGSGANRTISHALGSIPGCIMVKRTDTAGAWQVYHGSLANTEYLVLNTTAAKATGATRWNSTTPTSTVFSLGTDATVNASGGTYIAYIYAHNAGGFGLTGTDNVISCGSFTTDASGNASVNLGYEPQFWLYKPTIAARYWTIYDTMRGWSQTQIANLNPNVADAEGGGSATLFYPTATGFDCVGSALDPNTQHIYIAIRRGPMKVPTDATKVFSPVTYSGSAGNQAITGVGFPPDLFLSNWRANTKGNFEDRLRGLAPYLQSTETAAEASGATNLVSYDMSGITLGVNNLNNKDGAAFVGYFYQRAPGFFDVVCYTGTGSATTFSHNLAAVPELIIFKRRSNANPWMVYCNRYNGGVNANQYYQVLNAPDSENSGSGLLNNTNPTSSVFTVGTWNENNASGSTYVAYLFATCAGVSKVGSYTGTGATQTIDCGFGAGGSRFVLIKRTDTTGDWYVWDSARGMISGTDPSLLLNSTAAEVNANSVYAISTGFQIVSTAAGINASAGTYIFLSVA